MSDGKGHTYLNKPAAFRCTFCLSIYGVLLPPDIKGLTHHIQSQKNLTKECNGFILLCDF